MHFSNTQYKKSAKGGSVVLLNKIKKMPQPVVEGGDIISNRIVGITSNPVRNIAPSRSMSSVGGMLNFNKHVSTASKIFKRKRIEKKISSLSINV
jgi:hypothetical protein